MESTKDDQTAKEHDATKDAKANEYSSSYCDLFDTRAIGNVYYTRANKATNDASNCMDHDG
jgi:hypothetical protein